MKLLDLVEVAELLGVSVKTLRNLINVGRVKAVRIGKQLRVSEAEMERIYREGTRPVSCQQQEAA